LLHLDDAELRALDRWIAGQPDPRPTRAEAAKRLLGTALART
jgi:cytochrome c553